jgi:hypothetical protein
MSDKDPQSHVSIRAFQRHLPTASQCALMPQTVRGVETGDAADEREPPAYGGLITSQSS